MQDRETGRKREQAISRGWKERIGGKICFIHFSPFIRDLNCQSQKVIA